MINEINKEIEPLIEKLENHKLNSILNNEKSLQIFMQHHVFAVWDFMNIVKTLQQNIAPVQIPWKPPVNPHVVRFIHELVLAEESDITLDKQSLSHFEMYLLSMKEIGADTAPIQNWVHHNKVEGVPSGSLNFLEVTQSILATGDMVKVASMFCYSREKLIPRLFSNILNAHQFLKARAPQFQYYIQRHIEIDGEEHGDLSVEILKHYCEENPAHFQKAKDTAVLTLNSRVQLWDNIVDNIQKTLAL